MVLVFTVSVMAITVCLAVAVVHRCSFNVQVAVCSGVVISSTFKFAGAGGWLHNIVGPAGVYGGSQPMVCFRDVRVDSYSPVFGVHGVMASNMAHNTVLWWALSMVAS